MEHYQIKEYNVTFDPIKHQYWVNNQPVISVTQIINEMLPKPYKNVNPIILKKAAEKGQALHDMIEHYERFGKKTYHIEMQGYLALKAQHQINVIENEKIVLIHHHGVVIAAGRFDMVVESPFIKGLGIVDVKRMAHIHEENLMLQLNLYKLGYEQTYKKRIDYLKCIHIRHNHHEYLDVPTNQDYVKELLDRFLEKHPINYKLYLDD